MGQLVPGPLAIDEDSVAPPAAADPQLPAPPAPAAELPNAMPPAIAGDVGNGATVEPGQLRDPAGLRVPERLSQTGLYSNISSQSVAPSRRYYRPRYELWSDAADKSRWLYLPPGSRIDTSDRDHWSFPVGTQVWKEFRVGGRRIETRLIQRVGPGRDEFLYATYQWRPDGSDADYVASGVPNAGGTGHDIPSHAACLSCHGYLAEHVLGVSALLLSHEQEGVNLRMLDAEGLLTTPEPQDLQVPGDATTQAALGYLHSNCGSCHNQAADPDAPLTGVQLPHRFNLRVAIGTARAADADACLTALDVPMAYASPGSSILSRLVGGGPEQSGLYHRTALRGDTQMPPLATKLVDAEGIAILSAWIARLPPPSSGGCGAIP